MNIWHHLPDIYFLHVPKTAGTSIRFWLQGLFAAPSLLPADHLAAMEKLSDEAIRECRIASGHFGWRFVERAKALGKQVSVFTFLREPLSLRLSSLTYAATRPDDDFSSMPPDAANIARNARLAARSAVETGLIDAPDFHPNDSLLPEAQTRSNTYIQNIVGHGFSATRPVEIDEHALRTASERISSMTSVGIVEEMEWSMALLCDALGLPFLPIAARENASLKKIQMTDRYAAMTQALNPHDQTLYDLAKSIVDERRERLLAKLGVDAAAPIDAIREPMRLAFLRNSVFSVERIRSGEITMADGLISEGFGPRSYYEPYERWIRWAGPQTTSVIYLPLAPGSNRSVRFEIAATMSEAIRDQLELWVNGHQIALERTYEVWTDEAFHLVCTGVIPELAIEPAAQYTALEFRVPQVQPTAPEHVKALGPAVSFALADIRIG